MYPCTFDVMWMMGGGGLKNFRNTMNNIFTFISGTQVIFDSTNHFIKMPFVRFQIMQSFCHRCARGYRVRLAS